MLRAAFLTLFAGQLLVACLVALAAVAVAGPQEMPSPWVAGVSVAVSTGQLLMGLTITAVGVRNAGRTVRRLGLHRPPAATPAEDAAPPDARPAEPDARPAEEEAATAEEAPFDEAAERRLRTARSAALSLALLAAVLLSTPAWFAAFAWATGQRASVLGVIGLLLATGYAFGIAQLGPLARAVALPGRPADGAERADG